MKKLIAFALISVATLMRGQPPTIPTPTTVAVMKNGTTLTAGFTIGASNTISLGGGTISGSGTFDMSAMTVIYSSVSAHYFLVGPTSGTGSASYRAITSADLPAISSLLDGISTTRGTILERGSSIWGAIAPGTNGFVFTSAGSGNDPTWTAIPTQVAGSNMQLQFNSSGTAFGGSANLTWDGTKVNISTRFENIFTVAC